MYNIPKLFIEGLQGEDQLDAGVRDDDVNLNGVKLKVKRGTCLWTETSQSENPRHHRQVNITKNTSAGPEAVGQVHTTNENQNFVRVTIDKGIMKGLNRMLKLPLDDNRPDLIAAFGPHVEIDPGKALSVPIQNKMKIGVAVEGALGPRGATATVVNREKEYRGHFKCQVEMKGNGLACGTERQIGDIIKKVKANRRGDDSDIAGLEVVSKMVSDTEFKNIVVFTMEGDLECRWDYEQSVEWK